LGRFNDLDFISAKADLKKDLSIELKLIGSYDVNINEIVQGM
jgi:hypothetical protein